MGCLVFSNSAVLGNAEEINLNDDITLDENSTAENTENSESSESGSEEVIITEDDSSDSSYIIEGSSISSDGSAVSLDGSEITSGNATGSGNIISLPEDHMIPDDVVSVVLPVTTNETYDFIMDPIGLINLYYNGSRNIEDDYPSLYFPNSEKKNSTTSNVATFINKSSVPVLLNVNLSVTYADDNPVTYTDRTSVEIDNNNNISFSIIPSELGSADKNATQAENKALVNDQAIDIGTDGTASATFYLASDENNFNKILSNGSEDAPADSVDALKNNLKYILLESDTATWSTAGFAITGSCNRKADWFEFAKLSNQGSSLSIHVSYNMTKLTEEQSAAIANGVTPDPTTGLIKFN